MGGGFADVRDGQTGEQPAQAAALARFDAVEQVLARFLTDAFQLHELIEREVVQIGDAADQAGIDELADHLLAEALDVQSGAAGERAQRLLQPTDTVLARAVIEDLFLVMFNRGATDGALIGEVKNLLLAGAQTGFRTQDIRDDLARFDDDHRVADADIFGADVVGVVQTGVADLGAGKLHGLQVGPRRQRAVLADEDLDVEQLGDGLLLLELVGDDPAGRFGGRAEALALTQIVDFDDQAVSFVRQIAEPLLPAVAVFDHLVDGRKRLDVRVDGETVILEEREPLLVGLELDAFGGAVTVGEQPQPAFGALLGIEELERAGAEVARVGVRLELLLLALFVDANEILARHVNFAANFEQLGGLVRTQAQGNAADGLEVVGDIVASLAVPAGGALLEMAVLVGQGNGDTVDLQLDDVGHVFIAEQPADAAVELLQLFGVMGVVDRQHRHGMPHLREALDGMRLDALRRTVGCDELRMRLFELLKLCIQFVVVTVGDFRHRLDVVLVVVVADLAAQLIDAVFGGGHGLTSIGFLGRRLVRWNCGRGAFLLQAPPAVEAHAGQTEDDEGRRFADHPGDAVLAQGVAERRRRRHVTFVQPALLQRWHDRQRQHRQRKQDAGEQEQGVERIARLEGWGHGA